MVFIWITVYHGAGSPQTFSSLLFSVPSFLLTSSLLETRSIHPNHHNPERETLTPRCLIFISLLHLLILHLLPQYIQQLFLLISILHLTVLRPFPCNQVDQKDRETKPVVSSPLLPLLPQCIQQLSRLRWFQRGDGSERERQKGVSLLPLLIFSPSPRDPRFLSRELRDTYSDITHPPFPPSRSLAITAFPSSLFLYCNNLI